MSARRIGLPVLVVAIAALVAWLIAAWWLRHYKLVDEVVPLPPRGEASYNPLYALKTALRSEGRTVDARQRLRLDAHALAPADTVLLLADPRTLSHGERDALVDWVGKGGHLILATPPPGTKFEEGVELPVLDQLGISVSNDDPVCFGLQVAKMSHHVEFCHGRPFWFDDEEADNRDGWFEEDSGLYGFARVPRGKGSVDVLAELDFLQNDKLNEGPHIALARQLLQPNWNAGGTFHLIYSANMPPWWKLLFDHGWRVLAAMALALFAWLWMRGERFGPLLPSAPMDRRSLLEHVQASGEHLYRYGKRATLYAAVHAAFLRRLRQRDPYAAALDGPAQIEALARRTGMSALEVEAALRYPRGNDRKDFVIRIARLLQLRRRL